MRFDVLARSWADLVFHVLAHVPSNAPSSVFDADYVAYCERQLGAAAERPLGADAQVLAAFASNHERFARLQRLAWLFATPDDDRRVERRALAELDRNDVAEPEVLAGLQRLGPEVEVLRCAAELERESHASLLPLSFDARALGAELSRVVRAAPALSVFRIGVVPALGRRGRLRGAEIWVGAPAADLGVSPSHVAWQAAHEATLAEVERIVPRQGESDRPAEHAALVLLAARAARAGLVSEHAAWLAHFGAGLLPLDSNSLAEPYRGSVNALLKRPEPPHGEGAA